MMTLLLRCVSLEVINIPTYDGLNEVDIFWMHLKGRYQKSSASRPLTGHYTLRSQDGGVRTREALMIGSNVGG